MVTSNPLIAVLLDLFVAIPTIILAFYTILIIPYLFFMLLDKLSDYDKESSLDDQLTAIGAYRRERYLEERLNVEDLLNRLENKYKLKRLTYGGIDHHSFRMDYMLIMIENLFRKGDRAIRDLHTDAIFYYFGDYADRVKKTLSLEDIQDLRAATSRLYRVFSWKEAADSARPLYTKRYKKILTSIKKRGTQYRKLHKQLAKERTLFENTIRTAYGSDRFSQLLRHADDPFFDQTADYAFTITKKEVDNYHIEQAIGKVEY